ncbi:MAG: hypothetical protein CML95_05075 [Rhodobiaceae bacterium]|nr:hypothetical protein [Rhodobiaceae bacterium]|tara:strand:+ start:922 stop:1578 length:657 start_codon:yes stop_codon:yes gene_type:complete
MRSGFSLIELLTVVAIIGLLAAIGTVGYQGYLEATQDEATKANQTAVARAINVDNLLITEGGGGPSEINRGVTATTSCGTQVSKILNEMNVVQKGKSPANSSCPRGFNGNLALNWPGVIKNASTGLLDGCGFKSAFTSASATVISVPRGMVMVACANSSASLKQGDYKIYTCVCSNQDYCNTTDVTDFCSIDPDPLNCQKNFLKNNPNLCPTPNTPQT